MGKGRLIVHVLADHICQPVSDAAVSVSGTRDSIRLRTDGAGQTEILEMQCPDREYSLTPQHEVRPYAVYQVEVRRTGLEPIHIDGVQILDGCDAMLRVYMRSQPVENAPARESIIHEHVLWARYPARTPERVWEKHMPGREEVWPVVPERIVVHDGLPVHTGVPEYTVSFTDYIKKVAAGMIYATWPREAILAFVTALVTTTLERLERCRYADLGLDFAVTSDTRYDYLFDPCRNHFRQISGIVDEVFWQYLRRAEDTRPVFCPIGTAEKAGRPGRLNVWEAVRQAHEGRDALSILRRAFGGDIGIAAASVAWSPRPWQSFPLRLGVTHEYIGALQIELAEIRAAYPFLPEIKDPAGCFGEDTQQAVTLLQRFFSLPETGVVELKDWFRIAALSAEYRRVREAIAFDSGV